MAFDQTTRNRLNKFVADSRSALAKEFTRQLQAIYGMNPATGDVADINSLSGLSPHQQETAQLLRDTFEHYLAANDHAKGKSKEKENRIAALDRIVREQAFTVLNRLAALRMSEARGFLTESLANGYDSKGFQLFHRIAGTSLGETGEAYTHYLFSIFDEFALDLSVLFDRFASQGRLFPSTPVLLELLALINDDEVAPLWAEDETIGWIYQYFNSQEERKKMRDASQAPRNSRELAVRNQFFTPRYVVEFLTDNTLGRIWYEMTKGQTKLIDECEYLVKRPNAIFLSEGEQAPEQESTEGLSQEELLQQTVYIEHRALKDPRDIRMLDPACGSMHFGLYCFDLFERIYEEAWDIEVAKGSECFVRENNQASLTQSYNDKAEFLTHVPRLIIENNIHGVDIDPRAAQVAGMSLWQRAHNSWQKASVKPQLRPQITKSNIVCAEPMPGEKEMLQEFSSQLKPTVLGQLVEVIFEKMQLAGEAGTLLKIEKEIEYAIAEAKAVWQQQNQALSQFPDLAKVAKQRGEVNFDVSDIDDEGFWQQAEQKILDALAQYASSTSADMNEQKRLFASDAAKGFAFIDLCKKRFDVVLMNPPFGKQSKLFENRSKKIYPGTWTDMYSSFFERTKRMLFKGGLVGAITSSQFLYTRQMRGLRDLWLKDNSLLNFIQLGHDVLDGAMVETGLTIFSNVNNNNSAYYQDLRETEDKAWLLKNKNNDMIKSINLTDFKKVDGHPFCFDAPSHLLKLWKGSSLGGNLGKVATGNHTFDDFRFVRLFFEVNQNQINSKWKRFDKGGEYQPYISPTKLLVDWEKNGAALRALNEKKYGSDSQVMQASKYWFKEGICYSHVSSVAFGPRILNKDTIFSSESISIFLDQKEKQIPILSFLNSSICQDLIWIFGKYRKIENRAVSGLPLDADFIENLDEQFGELSEKAICTMTALESLDETSPYFTIPDEIYNLVNNHEDIRHEITLKMKDVAEKVDRLSTLSLLKKSTFSNENGSAPRMNLVAKYTYAINKKEADKRYSTLSYFTGVIFGRWDINISTYEVENPFDQLPITQPSANITNNEKSVFSSDELSILLSDIITKTFSNSYDNFLSDTLKLLNIKNLGDVYSNPRLFFDFHLKRYSESRRQAPIYWPIQTSIGSYCLWINYHSLTTQSLLICINNFVEPKLEEVNSDLFVLASQSGPKSAADEKEIDKLTDLKNELEVFRDELFRLTRIWQPNLNDGVQITAAPLWRLFQHKAWQKKLKHTWEKLEEGEYDWAHLAFSTWPERVLKKCHADRSLAIAHDVESDLWHEVEVIKGKKKEPVWEWQPKPLSDTELHAYIREKIATDERLKLYRSNQSASANGGAL